MMYLMLLIDSLLRIVVQDSIRMVGICREQYDSLVHREILGYRVQYYSCPKVGTQVGPLVCQVTSIGMYL